MAKEPCVTKLPINSLFIDGVHEVIFYGGITQDHGKEGDGYQRNPYDRLKWLTARSETFDPALMKPVDVSKRPDGRYAIIDGGGRWVMAQQIGQQEIECRVHTGLSRKEEAILFVKFDREIYRVRQVEQFLAALAAENPTAVGIDHAIKPYCVERTGVENLDSPSTLAQIYNGGEGALLLKKTALIVANTWGGLEGGKFTGMKVRAAEFGAVALVVTAAPAGWNEGVFREVLNESAYAPARLADYVKPAKGEQADSMADKMLTNALRLAKRYNFVTRKGPRIEAVDVKSSDLCERLQIGGGNKLSFGNVLTSTVLRPKAA